MELGFDVPCIELEAVLLAIELLNIGFCGGPKEDVGGGKA